MSDSNGYIAEMLRVSAKAYAAHAAERLLERHPDCAAQFGNAAFRNWRDNLTHRLNELAIALEMNEPALFASQLRWSRDAFEARAVPIDHLQHSLVCLRETLREDLPEGSRDRPTRFIDQAISEMGESHAVMSRLAPDSDHTNLALRYVEAVLAGNRRRAIQLIVDAVEGGLSMQDAYEKVLLPAPSEIGLMWHVGEISVSEEHAATETTRTVMGILSQHTPSAAEDAPTVLVAAVEGDRHDIGVRAVADLVELAGYRTISLGSDVPVADLALAVDDFDPDVVILAASLSLHLNKLKESVRAARETGDGSKRRVIVGGPAFAESRHIAERVGADGFASSPGEAVRLVVQFTAQTG